jgi:signal transduction histidine kinase
LLTEAAHNLDNDQLNMLHNIRSSSQFMFNLVENLLDISTIETGKLRLDKTNHRFDGSNSIRIYP